MGSYVNVSSGGNRDRFEVSAGGIRVGKTLKAKQAQAEARAAGLRVVSLESTAENIPFDIPNGKR
jgi:hypothetical protein